jgi:hypothetical protein
MKNKIIGLVLPIIIVLAAGFYFMKVKTTSPTANTKPTATIPTGKTKMMSLKELMTLGTSQKCTFESSDDKGTTKGISYINKNRMRGDITISNDTKVIESHIINDGTYMYSWSTDMDKGIKIPITAVTTPKVEAAEDYPQGYNEYLDQNKQLDYDCSNWNTDESMFIPPTNVTFTDFSEQMKTLEKMQTQVTSGATENSLPENKCAVCDSLPAESQAACRQGLGC